MFPYDRIKTLPAQEAFQRHRQLVESRIEDNDWELKVKAHTEMNSTWKKVEKIELDGCKYQKD